MKRIIIIAAVLLAAGASCVKKTDMNGQWVLAGTTMIESLLRDTAGNIDVMTLVPPGACPGHFDLKPEDAEKISRAKIIIMHPFQKYLAEKIKKVNSGIEVRIIDVMSLSTPGGYFAGLEKTECILNEFYPGKAGVFRANTGNTKKKINSMLNKDKEEINRIMSRRYKVVSSEFQLSVCSFFRFRIIDTFGDPKNLSVKRVKELAEAAGEADFIISNRTGTHDESAEIIRKKTGKKKAVLLSFPAENGKKGMFEEMWRYNFEKIKAAE